jgi:hypothetical protein
MWDLDLICELAAKGLERRARELDAEGSVRGIDCMKELELHAILREALGVELPWGGGGGRFGVLEGERCDIVLLPPATGDDAPGGTPGSPVGTPGLPRRGDAPADTPDAESPWRRRLLDPLEAGTLFEGFGVPPEDALWIEVKVAGQFAVIDGIGRPNPSYSSTLLREVPADARKLASDPIIRDGAVLVVVFNADEVTAAHDLEAWRVRGIDKGWPFETPFVRTFAIADRIGNRVASVVVGGVRR